MGTATAARRHPLLTSRGRAALPFRHRVGAALAVVAGLHLAGLGLLVLGVVAGTAGAVTVGLAAVAYLRGLVHSFDFDHIAMIDNSTRKFVAEGRSPASVGLAFSLGHSTVVVLTGVLVIAGAGFIRTALDESSGAARVLGVIGVSVSGLYLVLVAVANLATFLRAWELRRALRADPHLEVPPHALTPRGPAAVVLTTPLRRVRHPWHVYVVGLLFSLGFDTSSQIGVLVLTAGAALAGASLVSLLCLPLLFTAAMTLGDTANGLLMLRMYSAADQDPARRITYNLVITGVGIASGLLVGALAAASLLSEQLGVTGGLVGLLTRLDTKHAGYVLAGFFAVVFAACAVAWRRARP
ncbi:HoxN/HupN/NixA family nickel/cobalt transporter [Quadrisphaera sp. KR29]|uniref:HoxN/HupN/NixA family nickel/cobalt transporter n=1 Tax=Quadrisphaera sp. KR29 TaxID=3461391 RepID=UPI00404448C8